MKLTVQLLTWNGAKYIPYLFDSLRKQTLKSWNLCILDNCSTDNTVELVRKELNNFFIQNSLEINEKNAGFAKGHNFLLKKSNSEYVLLLNQDIFLREDSLEKMIDFLNVNSEAAAVSPRLMKWDFVDKNFTDKIDSLGLKIYRSRRAVDFMSGENWEKKGGQVVKWSGGQVKEVFGVSGALPMFRRALLNDSALSNGDIFDESYGSYKEDVDLAYRLRSRGHKAFTLLDAVAFHDRSSGSGLSMLKNKGIQSHATKYNSYKNHLMTIYKNEYWQNFMLDFFWILCYELSKFMWFLIFDGSVLKGWKDIWILRKKLKHMRHEIKNRRKVDWLVMRKWI